MPKVGIEPTYPRVHDFESCASAYSATSAGKLSIPKPAWGSRKCVSVSQTHVLSWCPTGQATHSPNREKLVRPKVRFTRSVPSGQDTHSETGENSKPRSFMVPYGQASHSPDHERHATV